MSNVIDGYRVTSSNGSARQKSAVRVYHPRGYRIAEQFVNCSNPLAVMRAIKRRSKHLDSLRVQCCVDSDMSENVFDQLFNVGGDV